MTSPLELWSDDIFLQHHAEGHPERPERLRSIVAAVRADERLAAATWHLAPDCSDADLGAVHPAAHVERVAQIAGAGGGWFDADTYCGPASYQVARRAVGATVEAVDAVCTGTVATAFALVRPPGHHAGHHTPMGFCLFNNVAVAIEAARRHHGVERVAVVDIDVHHGNGTEDIFAADADVLYTSLHQWPFYPGTGGRQDRGSGAGTGATLNVPLPEGTSGAAWLAALRDPVLPAVRRHRPQLIVVSAGFDAHEADPIGGLGLPTDAYGAAAELIANVAGEVADGRMLWALEGGYDLDALRASVPLTMRKLLGGPP
ncbi:MAG: histone deacetylase [Candidatus Dormibacteria bacterium]